MLTSLIATLLVVFFLAASVGNTRAFFYEQENLDYTIREFVEVSAGFLIFSVVGIIGANYKMFKALSYFVKLALMSKADLRQEIRLSKEEVSMKFNNTVHEEDNK